MIGSDDIQIAVAIEIGNRQEGWIGTSRKDRGG